MNAVAVHAARRALRAPLGDGDQQPGLQPVGPDFPRPDGHRRGDRPPGAPLGGARVRRAELSNGSVTPDVAAITTPGASRTAAGAAVAAASPRRLSLQSETIGDSRSARNPEPGFCKALACARRLPHARSVPAVNPLRGSSACAEHDRQLGGASPLSSPMAVKGLAKRKGVVARRGLKEAWSKAATRWSRTGYEAYPAGRTSA